jgi:predicted ATPase
LCIEQLTESSEVRLLTLTDAGGVGKSRLALQVTTALGEDFDVGVTSIQLAPISDTDLVFPTIPQALGLTGSGAGPFLAMLQAALRDKHLLLLLDNCEQVQPAAPQPTELLAVCPDLKLLVTSSAVLYVQGELASLLQLCNSTHSSVHMISREVLFLRWKWVVRMCNSTDVL